MKSPSALRPWWWDSPGLMGKIDCLLLPLPRSLSPPRPRRRKGEVEDEAEAKADWEKKGAERFQRRMKSPSALRPWWWDYPGLMGKGSFANDFNFRFEFQAAL